MTKRNTVKQDNRGRLKYHPIESIHTAVLLRTMTMLKGYNVKKTLLLFSLLASLAVLSGCPFDKSSDPPAPIPDQDASGIFTGSGDINSITRVEDFKAIIYNNRFLIFSTDKKLLYDGTISKISSNDLTATADLYDSGVKSQSAFKVTGTVTTESQMTLELVGTGKASGQVQLTYNDIYHRGATDARINSDSKPAWKGDMYHLQSGHCTNNFVKNDTPPPSINITFRTVENTYTNQCAFYGTISIPASTLNIYSVSQTRNPDGDLPNHGDCPYSTSPDSTGLATVVDSTGRDDSVWYVASNGTHSIFGVLTREHVCF